MKRILVVEDNPELHELIKKILKNTYLVFSAYSGSEAMLIQEKESFDLILLDMMLPGITGDKLLVKIREKVNTPVIMLTAVSEKKTISELLLSGANDYITKPFDIDELLARINVQLRNDIPIREEVSNNLFHKNIELDLTMFQLKKDNETIDLSRKEAALLRLLIQYPKKIYTKEDIYERVWKENYYGDENTVNVHISNLRKKITELDNQEKYIDTVWGIGIKLSE